MNIIANIPQVTRAASIDSRAVKGIDGNIGLNKALWHLAEQMKALKA
jgi:hypothetical protein